MPKYMKISSSGIRICTKVSGLHSAISIASADAFFLVVGKSALRTGMELSGGLLGSLLGNALDRFSKKKCLIDPGAAVVEMKVEDLPEEVLGHPDWPAGVQQGTVIVIPREAIISVHYSFWRWGIFVQTDKVEFRIVPPLFGRKKVLQFLRDTGWEL